MDSPQRDGVVGAPAPGVTSPVPEIDDLIARSSIGKGLQEQAFGRALRDLRLRFRITVAEVCKHSNISRLRLMEIEEGTPPTPSKTELEAIASAIGVPVSRLENL